MTTQIVGAGLAGLIAGNLFPTAQIFEQGEEQQLAHKAVLRFRTPAVGEAVGIDFRRVPVHKGLWLDREFVQPNIRLANQYSHKVIGRLFDRSVWKTETVERFIAPENLLEQLAERCRGRIEWSSIVSSIPVLAQSGPTISTAPMSVLAQHIDNDATAPQFNFAPIEVQRWRVPEADVFQTVYFPSPDTTLYRASITGSLLIAEYAGRADMYDFFPAFGLNERDVLPIDNAKQRFGKIAPIDDTWRKNFIFRMSQQHNIFSLGRFATWRNILLDDVLKDCYVIKRLLTSASPYDAKLHAHNGARS